MVPSLRIETDPSPAIPRQEPRAGSPLELGGKGFSTYLKAARPAEAPREPRDAPRAEDPAPAEAPPKAPVKAETAPDPKAEPRKAEAPDPRAKPLDQDEPRKEAEGEVEPNIVPPQPLSSGLEAALLPPLAKLPPAGVLPPEALASPVEPGATPPPTGAKSVVAVSVAPSPLPNDLPIDLPPTLLPVQAAKVEAPIPVPEGQVAPIASNLKPSLSSPETLQVEAPAPANKAAELVPLAKTFMVSEQFNTESPTVAFTLPAERHPLVREMMAQLRPEPEALKPSARMAPEPKLQPGGKTPVEQGPEVRPKAEARPEETPTSAVPGARETQAPKAHSPEGGLPPTTLRIAAAAPSPEGMPTPMVQPLGTPSTVTATLAAPAAVATAPHPAAVQVEGGIRWLLSKERSGAELQLHPESLGRITIQLRVDQGEVHARVWATEPSTLPLLQDHKAFLEVSLRQQGLSLGSFDLQQGQRGGQPQADPGTWQGNARPVTGIAALDSGQDSPVMVPTPSAYRGLIEVFA